MLPDRIEDERKWRADPASPVAISSTLRPIATQWLLSKERLRELSPEGEPRIAGIATVNPPLESKPAQAPAFGEPSKLPERRDHRDRRHSNLSPTSLEYFDKHFGVREELLSRLLVDEKESLNRLYDIVSPVGLRILFFDDRKRLVGSYDNCDQRRP